MACLFVGNLEHKGEAGRLLKLGMTEILRAVRYSCFRILLRFSALGWGSGIGLLAPFLQNKSFEIWIVLL